MAGRCDAKRRALAGPWALAGVGWLETDDTSPDRDAADGMLLLRLTVDEDGLLWDIELRQPQGRVFWISVDEFSKDPFSPPTPVS